VAFDGVDTTTEVVAPPSECDKVSCR